MLTVKCYDLSQENNQLIYKKINYDEDKILDESYNIIANHELGSIITDDGILCGTHYYQRLHKSAIGSSSGNNYDFELQRKKEINGLAL